MSEANNHELEGPTQYPRPLEGSKPEIPSLTELTAQPKGRQRWAKPAEIAMTLLFAAGVAYFGWEMNSQDQAAKEANFGLAKATAQTEVNQISARATEFTAIVIPTATKEPTVAPAVTKTIATAEPTATAEPSPTEKPTIEPTKAATATPEAPQVVYKTVEEVIPILIKEAQEGHLMVVDVWSSKGAKIDEGISQHFDTLIFNGFKPNETFESPITGKVESIAIGEGRGFTIQSITIMSGKVESSFAFNVKDQILVKEGAEIVPGMPLAQLTGDTLPSRLGLIKNGQIFQGQVSLAADVNKQYGFNKESILRENEMVVNIAPQGGK